MRGITVKNYMFQVRLCLKTAPPNLFGYQAASNRGSNLRGSNVAT